MKEQTITLMQKVKVINKLSSVGISTEDRLQKLTMDTILEIPGITIPDMAIISCMQKAVRDKRFFSYLCDAGQEANGPEVMG